MPKYDVTVSTTITQSYDDLEANNEKEAIEIAEDIFIEDHGGFLGFNLTYNVEEIKE